VARQKTCVKKSEIFTEYSFQYFFIIDTVEFAFRTNFKLNIIDTFMEKIMSKSGGNSNGGRGQGNGGGWPSGTGNPSGGGRSNAPSGK